jgi:hypothetical protein
MPRRVIAGNKFFLGLLIILAHIDGSRSGASQWRRNSSQCHSPCAGVIGTDARFFMALKPMTYPQKLYHVSCWSRIKFEGAVIREDYVRL